MSNDFNHEVTHDAIRNVIRTCLQEGDTRTLKDLLQDAKRTVAPKRSASHNALRCDAKDKMGLLHGFHRTSREK